MIKLNRLPEDIIERINLLKDFFMREPNVVFVYLFGGLTKARHNPLSDVDLAVYVKALKKLNYLRLFSDIHDVLGTGEIDLVILNTAPISLTGRVLKDRVILVDKNPFLRHEYESLTFRKYFDFSIKERDILKRRYGIG
jgi:predicted nucleotidyltransferase